MTTRTGWVATLLTAVLLPAAGAGEITEESLTRGLAEARALIDGGKLQPARALLAELAEAHADSDHVLLHVHRLTELLGRCAFHAAHAVPPPQELVSGDLLSLDRRSGKIKVRYVRKPLPPRPEEEREADDDDDDDGIDDAALRELLELLGIGGVDTGDFTWALGVPMHPMIFSGAYTVEIKGRMPEDEADFVKAYFGIPRMVIDAGEEGYYDISFGRPRSRHGFWATASVVHRRGGRRTVLDEDRGTPLDFGKPYSVKVQVTSKSINCSANGRTFLKGAKQGDAFGRFGFRGCPQVEELIVSGQANVAWIDGLADAWLARAWRTFGEEHDPRNELPERLRKRLGEASVFPESPLAEFPGGEHERHGKHLEILQGQEKRGEYERMLGYVDRLEEESCTPSFRRHVRATCLSALGDHAGALAVCDELLAEHPGHVPTVLLKSRTLSALNRDDEALQTLREATEGGLTDPRPHTWLASWVLHRDGFQAATAVLQQALAAGVAPADLQGAASMLTRAAHGPDFTAPAIERSKNYIVVTDLDQRAAADVARVLEQSLDMYHRLFGRLAAPEDAPRHYPVYFFAGQSGYLSYTRDLFGGGEGSAGMYSPTLKQLVIWNLPDRELLVRTIRHEGFHQFLDRRADDVPTWFNEGTAEYFETASLQRGRMTPGEPVLGNLTFLVRPETEWLPLDELLRADGRTFYARPTLHYAQSWALVHYLLHSGRVEKRMYDDFLAALVGGATGQQATEQVFGGVDLAALLRKLKQHVKALEEQS